MEAQRAASGAGSLDGERQKAWTDGAEEAVEEAARIIWRPRRPEAPMRRMEGDDMAGGWMVGWVRVGSGESELRSGCCEEGDGCCREGTAFIDQMVVSGSVCMERLARSRLALVWCTLALSRES